MILKGIYETHLSVSSLDRSIDFYKNKLGLQQCLYGDGRKLAFFWVGKEKEYMLGLWEKPGIKIESQHFAFRCDTDFILDESIDWLQERGLTPYNFLKDGTLRPMVFSWMPALSIYFDDPDGHVLEFISVLDGVGKPELGIIDYAEWMKLSQ